MIEFPPPPNFRALLPTFHTTDTLIFSLEILDIHLDSEQVSNLIQRLIHTDDAGKGPRCCEDWIAFVFPVSWQNSCSVSQIRVF